MMSATAIVCQSNIESPSTKSQQSPALIDACDSMIAKAVAYSMAHLEDMPEIRDWAWGEPT